jgi:hypothetical protein
MDGLLYGRNISTNPYEAFLDELYSWMVIRSRGGHDLAGRNYRKGMEDAFHEFKQRFLCFAKQQGINASENGESFTESIANSMYCLSRKAEKRDKMYGFQSDQFMERDTLGRDLRVVEFFPRSTRRVVSLHTKPRLILPRILFRDFEEVLTKGVIGVPDNLENVVFHLEVDGDDKTMDLYVEFTKTKMILGRGIDFGIKG